MRDVRTTSSKACCDFDTYASYVSCTKLFVYHSDCLLTPAPATLPHSNYDRITH